MPSRASYAVVVFALLAVTAATTEDEAPSPPPSPPTICVNTCSTSTNMDCEDGGRGSVASTCDIGTDCDDCGERTVVTTIAADGTTQTLEEDDDSIFFDGYGVLEGGPDAIEPWLGGWWLNKSLTSDMAAQLTTEDGIVIIKNFLSEKAAAKVHAELLRSKVANASWSEAGGMRAGFQAKYEKWFPKTLEEASSYPFMSALHKLFKRTEFCDWAAALVGGKKQVPRVISMAANYRTGDYMTAASGARWDYHQTGGNLAWKDKTKPGQARRLAFHLHLAKDWELDWGGDLVFLEPHIVIPPSFNTLILYPVGITKPTSISGYQLWHEAPPPHLSLVTPVTSLAAKADAHRFEVFGWWHSIEQLKFLKQLNEKSANLSRAVKQELRAFALPIDGNTGEAINTDTDSSKAPWIAKRF